MRARGRSANDRGRPRRRHHQYFQHLARRQWRADKYTAAKAGVAAMTVTWAKELARHKIRVAGIAPGFSETRMVATIPPPIVQEKIVAGIPVRRFAKPDEIARAALFILQNDYTTVEFQRSTGAYGDDRHLGRRLNLKNIRCPGYLLAGVSDDITTKEQVFDAEKYLGTPKDKIEKRFVPGGYIGLFMGSRTLKEAGRRFHVLRPARIFPQRNVCAILMRRESTPTIILNRDLATSSAIIASPTSANGPAECRLFNLFPAIAPPPP